SPVNDAVGYVGSITSTYVTTNNYKGTQDWVLWECSTTEEFTNIVDSYEGNSNLTSWTPSISLVNTQIFVRTKQGSDGHRSEYSNVVRFTTPDIHINTPTITVEGTPNDVPETPVLTGSAFSVFNGSDTHVSTDWAIEDDGVVVWSS